MTTRHRIPEDRTLQHHFYSALPHSDSTFLRQYSIGEATELSSLTPTFIPRKQISRSKDWQACLMFGMFWIQTSIRKQTIPTDDFIVLLSPSGEILGQFVRFGHDNFVSHLFEFNCLPIIIYSSLYNLIKSLSRGNKSCEVVDSHTFLYY